MFSLKTPISLKSLAHKSLQDLHDSWAKLPFQPSPHLKMPGISIAAEGMDKLLKSLSPNNAAGPNKLKPIVLQTLHKGLAPKLQLIFQRSIDTGKYETLERSKCFPNLQKGEKSDPSNYRPISLTCVLCKILEHIVTELDIFYEMQHGFREKRSCETQLLLLIDRLSKTMQTDKQTDLILLDFSKSFD